MPSSIENLEPIEKELYIVLAMYYKSQATMYCADHAGLEATLRSWFYPRTSVQEIQATLSRYPTVPYPDTCICGATFNDWGSVLRNDCAVCEGIKGSGLGVSHGIHLTDYDFGMIAGLIGVHYRCYLGISKARLKSLVSWVIWNSNQEREYEQV